MSRNYTCTVCGATGNTNDPAAPCNHGYQFQQMGFERRSRASKKAKLAVWNQGVSVTKTARTAVRSSKSKESL